MLLPPKVRRVRLFPTRAPAVTTCVNIAGPPNTDVRTFLFEFILVSRRLFVLDQAKRMALSRKTPSLDVRRRRRGAHCMDSALQMCNRLRHGEDDKNVDVHVRSTNNQVDLLRCLQKSCFSGGCFGLSFQKQGVGSEGTVSCCQTTPPCYSGFRQGQDFGWRTPLRSISHNFKKCHLGRHRTLSSFFRLPRLHTILCKDWPGCDCRSRFAR